MPNTDLSVQLQLENAEYIRMTWEQERKEKKEKMKQDCAKKVESGTKFTTKEIP